MGVKPFEKGIPARTLPGMKLLKPTSKNRVFTMSYNKGRTLIRPWGTVQADGTMMPWRDQNGNFGTSWFIQDLVAMGWGLDMRFTAFMEVEDTENWPGGSPLQLFLDDMKAHEDFQHKYKLFKRKGTFSPLDNPKGVGLIRGLLLETQGKEFFNRPIWGAVIPLLPTAKDALEALINQPAPGGAQPQATEADPQGWNSQYLVGDPIGFKTGKVFEFHKESAFKDGAAEINLNGEGGAASTKDDIEGYGCRIWADKPTIPLDPAKVAKFDEPFEESLRFMNGEEQLEELIIPGYGRSAKELVLYTFGGKGILPDSFEFGKATVDMGSTPNGVPEMDTPTEESDAPYINMDAPSGPEVNLGEEPTPQGVETVSGGPDINLGEPEGDDIPFEADAPAAAAPAAESGGTAGDIRARLAAATGGDKK